MTEETTYLGDGVYVSFDGYHVWLAANHHENKVVALEPGVMRSLLAYIKTIPANFQESRWAICETYGCQAFNLGNEAADLRARLDKSLKKGEAS